MPLQFKGLTNGYQNDTFLASWNPLFEGLDVFASNLQLFLQQWSIFLNGFHQWLNADTNEN